MKISKAIPIPPRKKDQYPWEQLEVGDSFMPRSPSRNSAYNVAKYSSLRLAPKKFECRMTAQGPRIWRTK